MRARRTTSPRDRAGRPRGGLLSRALEILLSTALLAGCSAQLGPGLEKTAAGWEPVLAFSAAVHASQRSGPVAGTTLVSRLGEAGGAPFRLRRGSIDMGYHFAVDDDRIEDGKSVKVGLSSLDGMLELGAGTPLDRTRAALSFYTGARISAQLPLWGKRERDLIHRTLSLWGDLAVTGRAGVWSMAEASGGGVMGAGELDLALRITFVSDLLSARAPEAR